MNVELPNKPTSAIGIDSKMAVSVADAVLLLYKTVKERKLKEFVKEMENGESKYGRFTRATL